MNCSFCDTKWANEPNCPTKDMTPQEIIEENDLTKKCHIFLSPVFGSIDPQEIVAFMLEKKLNNVKLQLQLHKIIWDPNTRGV